MTLDPKNIRKDFPILDQEFNGHTLTYLDSASSSLVPEPVLRKMNEYYENYKANVHRGLYPNSERATEEFEKAREKVRKFINAESSREIIFTRNTTESINLVVNTWGRANLSKGDTVVLSEMEHHSNIVPWQILQKEKKFKIHYLKVDTEGRLDLKEYEQVLDHESVKFVSLVHQSNVLGTVNPVKEMIRLAHEHGALFLVDAAQSAAHMKVDLGELDADFFAFSGHKICGPTGIGVLYGKEKILEAMPPFMGGGEMIKTVDLKRSTWNDLPHKFEAGTPHIAGAIGLGAAIDYLEGIGLDEIHDYEGKLLKYTLEKMKNISGIKIFGPSDTTDRGAVIAFTLDGVHPHDIASLLGEKNICLRAGHHCAQPLAECLGVPATARLSLYFYNTEEDIDKFIAGLEDIKTKFKL